MFNKIRLILFFCLSFAVNLCFAQSKETKYYVTKLGIDSVLRNKGNLLNISVSKKPLLSVEGQMYSFDSLKNWSIDRIAKITVYKSLKGTGYEQYGKESNGVLVYIKTSLSAMLDKTEGANEISISESNQNKTEEPVDKIYSFFSTETPPEYPGGIQKFNEFITNNLKYPTKALEDNIQGKVYVSFIVEKDGSLSTFKIARKLGSGTDEEAIRLLKISKRWKPGYVRKLPVRTSHTLPINFLIP